MKHSTTTPRHAGQFESALWTVRLQNAIPFLQVCGRAWCGPFVIPGTRVLLAVNWGGGQALPISTIRARAADEPGPVGSGRGLRVLAAPGGPGRIRTTSGCGLATAHISALERARSRRRRRRPRRRSGSRPWGGLVLSIADQPDHAAGPRPHSRRRRARAPGRPSSPFEAAMHECAPSARLPPGDRVGEGLPAVRQCRMIVRVRNAPLLHPSL